MFQPTKEWVDKVNLSSFELENFFKFGACVISARKAKQLDTTTMFTYSHANTALGQSERAYYLSYFINRHYIMEARPCIIVHGGAWAIPDILKEASVNGVKRAAQKGYDCLKQVKK